MSTLNPLYVIQSQGFLAMAGPRALTRRGVAAYREMYEAGMFPARYSVPAPNHGVSIGPDVVEVFSTTRPVFSRVALWNIENSVLVFRSNKKRIIIHSIEESPVNFAGLDAVAAALSIDIDDYRGADYA